MSINAIGLSDEQLAFMLQQEEFGGLPIKHIVLPHVPSSSTSRSSNTPSKPTEEDDVIVLDSSDDGNTLVLAEGQQNNHRADDDTLGVLDVHSLFVTYNNMYFEGRLDAVTVEWSNRMTLCAGLCSWQKNGDCRIKLSSKLLQYRSNKELKETLLHECIHAYLFVTHNNKDRDAHGPEFLKKMAFINQKGGFAISVYHTFHEEVSHHRTHWWQCDRCQYIIKRAMNRAPGPSDWWFPRHQRDCGGQYVKIKSPPEDEKKRKRRRFDAAGESDEMAPTAKKPKSLPGTPSSNSTKVSSSGASNLPKTSIFERWKVSGPPPTSAPTTPNPKPDVIIL